MCQPIHKNGYAHHKDLVLALLVALDRRRQALRQKARVVPGEPEPDRKPACAISMTRIQACGHLHVPAAVNSSAAVAAFTAIVEMMSFAIMSAPISGRSTRRHRREAIRRQA